MLKFLRLGCLDQCVQRDGLAAENTFQKIFACVDSDADDPRLFVLFALKRLGVKDILQNTV